MEVQKTDWGEILWLDEKQELDSLKGLKVGIVTLFPQAHQHRHVHYEEQVCYVLSGQARNLVDGREQLIGPGDLFHWKAGIRHEIYNVGDQSFSHLLISNPEPALEQIPLFQKADDGTERTEPGEMDGQLSADLIYVAAEAIRTQFLETLHYGYGIFDALGNLVLQSHFFPEYCQECCQPEEHLGKCPCMGQLTPEHWEQEQVFTCPNGMQVFHLPLVFRGQFLGFIQSGYVRRAGEASGRLKEVYEVPESVFAGVQALQRRIGKAICNYCEFEQFRRELTEKELRIATQEESQRILMKNLQDAQSTVTDLKINNHFLFNTLNSMADMALEGGLLPLYQSIVDLSKMFRYTLRTQGSMVPLEKELEYVKAYLQLQKLRYEETLKVTYRVEKRALKVMVPFHFLQPVVENAFVHGFPEGGIRRIRILIAQEGQEIQVAVSNNTGTRLSEQNCYQINQGIRGNTSHGLSMVYHKLQAAYERPCGPEIASEKNGMTCVRMVLPAPAQAEGRKA